MTTRLPRRVRMAPATSPASAAPTITTSVSRSPAMATSAQEGVEPRLHPLVREHRPLERAADERLLLARARKGLESGLGVAAVLLLGLDVDEVELHRVARDVVVAERLHDHLGAVRTAGHLQLDAETEGPETLLEGRAAEVPDGRGRADGRGQGEMVSRLRLVDAEPRQEFEIEIAVVGLAQEAHLAGQVGGDQACGVALDDGGRVGQPGRQRGDGGLDVVVHVLRPQAELLGRELALEEYREEAALHRMGLLEGEAFVQELARAEGPVGDERHGSLSSAGRGALARLVGSRGGGKGAVTGSRGSRAPRRAPPLAGTSPR